MWFVKKIFYWLGLFIMCFLGLAIFVAGKFLKDANTYYFIIYIVVIAVIGYVLFLLISKFIEAGKQKSLDESKPLSDEAITENDIEFSIHLGKGVLGERNGKEDSDSDWGD